MIIHRPFNNRLFVLVLFLFAIGCGQGRESGTDQNVQLIYGVENEATSLDPAVVQDPYTIQILGLIYDGLVTLDDENEIEPALAESWEANEDFTRWTFSIRRGVKFHSDDVFGSDLTREVTAEDVKFSFQRLVSPNSYPSFVVADAIEGVPAFQAGEVDSVSGLIVKDPYTFEIHLQRPEPAFLHRITSPWYTIFPREAVEQGPDIFGREKAVGTGPFRLISRSNTEVVLERNLDYWKETDGNVDRVIVRAFDNDQIRLTELRNGNISVMPLSTDLAEAILEQGNGELELRPAFRSDFESKAYPTFNFSFVGFNNEKLSRSLRRAISLGINRQEIVDAITNGTALVATGPVPIGLLGYEPPFAGDIYDQAAAKRELEASDFDPSTQSIQLLVVDRDLGALVKAQLEQIGLNVELEQANYNAVFERIINGSAEAYAIDVTWVFSAPEVILNNTFNSAKIPVPNIWRYENQRIDAALDSVRSVADRDAVNAIARRVERQAIEDAALASLYQSRNFIIFDDAVSNLGVNGHGVPAFWNVTVEEREF